MSQRTHDPLDERRLIGLLADLYGALLTERQRQLLRMYYDDDLSMGEIAAQAGITRQGVHDLLRRTLATLRQYDRCLGLSERLALRVERVALVRALLRSAYVAGNERVRDLMTEADRLVAALAED